MSNNTPRGYSITPEQQRASEPNRNVWVSASAGSGKTSVLVDRILKLLITGTAPSSLLCLTFTKAAAQEMSSRLIGELARWVNADDSKLEKILNSLNYTDSRSHDFDSVRCLFATVLETPGGIKIQTIHSFCETLLRRFPVEAGVSPHFSILDDHEARRFLLDARDKVFFSTNSNKVLSRELEEIVKTINEAQFEQLLKQLLSQYSRIEQMWKIHGGLESTIETTCNFLGVSPDETIETAIASACIDAQFEADLLFCVADELLNGSITDEKMGLVIKGWLEGTFSDRCEKWTEYASIYMNKQGTEVRSRLVTKKTLSRIPKANQILRKEATRIIKVVEHCRRIHTARSTRAMLVVFESIYSEYQRNKTDFSRLDYSDLVRFSRKLLRQPDIGSWVLFKLDGGIDHILVDEAQDTNPDQWAVITALTTEFFSGHGSRAIGRTLFVVGDEKQSIYSFQGADPKVFKDIRTEFQKRIQSAEKPWDTLPLSRSFRTVPVVLRFVDTLFETIEQDQDNDKFMSERWRRHEAQRIGDGGLVELWPLEKTQHLKRENWSIPSKQHHAVTSEAKLAKRIALHIGGWLKQKEILVSRNRPIEAGDIMILVRQRRRLFEEIVWALKRHGVPVAGVDRMVLTEQLAVEDLMAVGHFALLPEDDLMLANVLKSPFIGFDDETLFDLAWGRTSDSLWECLLSRAAETPKFNGASYRLKEILVKSRQESPFNFFSNILIDGGRAALLDRLGEEANDPIDEFLNLALDFESNRVPSLQGFLNWLRVNSGEMKRDLGQTTDRVRVMTVHGAKGLEAPIVFLPDTTTPPRRDQMFYWTEKGEAELVLWPAAKGDEYDRLTAVASEQDKVKRDQEYKRLLYVAVTRAQDRLYVCGAMGRNQIPRNSWYALAENAMAALGSQVKNFNTVVGNEQTKVKRIFESQTSEVQPKSGSHSGHAPLSFPGRLRSMPNMGMLPTQVIMPSRLHDSAVKRGAPFKGESSWFHRGRSIHRLLEVLPNISVARRKIVAKSLLSKQEPRADHASFDSLIEEVLHTIEDPQFAVFFGPSSIAEAPIVATIDDKRVSGRIDRLVILDHEVLVADYKTDQSIPSNFDGISETYKQQIAAYRQALLQIYPSHNIRCFFLWTSVPVLMEIPSTLLNDSITSGPRSS